MGVVKKLKEGLEIPKFLGIVRNARKKEKLTKQTQV